ncbi:MAG: PAS domain-containing protein [Myxococcota bacterium]|nr:PAS domain-containing protein [Myxococcota bacterium]
MSPDRSLLAFVDAPVVVGDPQGRAVYANPAFAERIAGGRDVEAGRPLAELFAGGGREAVLRAVARACGPGATARFRVREAGVGYAGVASPIVAEGERVGVVILLKEEVDGGERLLGLVREIAGPLERLGAALDALLEQTGGRRAERYRALVEDGFAELRRARKGLEEMHAVLAGAAGAAGPPARFEPAALMRRVRDRVRARWPDAPTLEVLAPASLPEASGDPDRTEELLVELAGLRLAADPAPSRLVLGVRAVGGAACRALVLSLCEPPGAAAGGECAPAMSERAVSLGATLHVARDPILGRTTLLRFPAA